MCVCVRVRVRVLVSTFPHIFEGEKCEAKKMKEREKGREGTNNTYTTTHPFHFLFISCFFPFSIFLLCIILNIIITSHDKFVRPDAERLAERVWVRSDSLMTRPLRFFED